MLPVHELEQQMARALEMATVPGAALAVVQRDALLYACGFGTTRAGDGGVPVSADTVFRIASVSKLLVCTAIMRLVEDGILDLDAPVDTYLPWFSLPTGNARTPLTLRRLLTHTSGLPPDTGEARPTEGQTLCAYVRDVIARIPLRFSPGTRWSYSNIGFTVIGCIAETVTATPFPVLMRELVFGPLEMRRTTFDPLRAAHDSLALPHDLAEDGTVVPVSPGRPDPMADPAGGAFSTLNDLANFACMHLSDGQFQGRQVLSPSSIQTMYGRQVDREPQPGVPYTPGEGQALAFALTPYDGTELVEHIGHAHGYFSIFTLLPSHQAGLILLLNRPEPGPFFAVLDTVLESLLGGSADTQPSSSAG